MQLKVKLSLLQMRMLWQWKWLEDQKNQKKRSPIWDHFDLVTDKAKKGGPTEGPRAACKYCGQTYACHSKLNGISSMKTHITNLCPKYEFSKRNLDNKKQKVLSFEPMNDEKGEERVAKISAIGFSVEACTKALAEMIIIDELPFRFVEGVGFRRFMRVVQPKWTRIPCRITIAKECLKMFQNEKRVLKSALKNQRVCFTTDTWTSLQNLNYMCLTAHFIDCDFKLHKKIINFCVVPNHKGETLGKVVEQCLVDWGIDKILTITVDNASSNNGLINFLKRKTSTRKTTILKHDNLHVRCCCHILNLVVSDGLKDIDTSIIRVRNIVKYVRSSPQRMAMFRSCVQREGIECTLEPCLDVATRWNSTYFMLERALIYQKAFERLEEENNLLSITINEDALGDIENDDVDHVVQVDEIELCDPTTQKRKGKGGWKSYGVPTSDDWDMVALFAKVLKLFYKATERFSGSLYATCNTFFPEMVLIESEIARLSNGTGSSTVAQDEILSALAHAMKRKFDKYWGNFEKINPLLLYGFVLDPRYKLTYLEYFYRKQHAEIVVKMMVEEVVQGMTTFYNWYVENGTNLAAATEDLDQPFRKQDDDIDMDPREKMKAEFRMHLEAKNNMASKSELERYLMEGCENLDKDKFDKFVILAWWKANSARFPILSQVARDVLAIPVSTVASESAFSTGGRILDPYRSSLSPKVVEALICAQNWLRAPSQISIRDLMDDTEKMEEALLESDGDSSTVIDL